MWSHGRDDLFSQWSRDEDDEEALRWAALEKLPTYDHARMVVLAMFEATASLLRHVPAKRRRGM